MQLTRYTDYSLRVLMYLALNIERSGEPVTASEIARRFSISLNHLSKIIHQLGLQGYIVTMRGRGGGIRLGKPPEQIIIGELVRLTEPTLQPVNCHEPPCPIAASCRLRNVLAKAQTAFLDVLDSYSLADMTRQPDTLKTLLGQAKSADPVEAAQSSVAD